MRPGRWSIVGGVALVLATAVIDGTAAQSTTDADIVALTRKHCVMCHSATPTHEAFDKPPKDITLETLDDLKRHVAASAVQLETRTMPLGNQTAMTDAEREVFIRWLRSVGGASVNDRRE